jgi:hypothetical protein
MCSADLFFCPSLRCSESTIPFHSVYGSLRSRVHRLTFSSQIRRLLAVYQRERYCRDGLNLPLDRVSKTRSLCGLIQIRVVSTLPVWATVGSTAVVTANSSATYLPANTPEYFACTSGQVLNFISTSMSTGYVTVTEMT